MSMTNGNLYGVSYRRLKRLQKVSPAAALNYLYSFRNAQLEDLKKCLKQRSLSMPSMPIRWMRDPCGLLMFDKPVKVPFLLVDYDGKTIVSKTDHPRVLVPLFEIETPNREEVEPKILVRARGLFQASFEHGMDGFGRFYGVLRDSDTDDRGEKPVHYRYLGIGYTTAQAWDYMDEAFGMSLEDCAEHNLPTELVANEVKFNNDPW